MITSKRQDYLIKSANRMLKTLDKIKAYDMSLMKNQINFYLPYIKSELSDFIPLVSKLDQLSIDELKQLKEDLKKIHLLNMRYFRNGIKKNDNVENMLQFLPKSGYYITFGRNDYWSTAKELSGNKINEMFASNNKDEFKEIQSLLLLMKNSEEQVKESKKFSRLCKYLNRELQHKIDTYK